jgi:hypothetical protein
MANEIQPAVEFQALPLEMIIAAPLTAAVKAQRAAAEATLDFIRGQLQGQDGHPKTPIMLAAEIQPTLPPNAGPDTPMPQARAVKIRAPLHGPNPLVRARARAGRGGRGDPARLPGASPQVPPRPKLRS